MSASLNVVFERPGFMLGDARLEILVDDEPLFDGTFHGDLAQQKKLDAGPHQLLTRIHVGPFAREKRYTVELSDGQSYTARLRYSRFWGNFTRKLELSPGTEPTTF